MDKSSEPEYFAIPFDLLGACGLYCGACYHYRASFPDGAHLLTDEERRGRPLEGYTCRGCRTALKYMYDHCVECEIRMCITLRGGEHCGDCPDYPCDKLRAFASDGRPHHVPIFDNLALITEMGSDRWLEYQRARWTCLACGQPYSWYEQTCHSCGAALPAYRRAR